jgi:hypothetical protein
VPGWTLVHPARRREHRRDKEGALVLEAKLRAVESAHVAIQGDFRRRPFRADLQPKNRCKSVFYRSLLGA